MSPESVRFSPSCHQHPGGVPASATSKSQQCLSWPPQVHSDPSSGHFAHSSPSCHSPASTCRGSHTPLVPEAFCKVATVPFFFSQPLLLPGHPAPATLAVILSLLPCLLLDALPRNLWPARCPKATPLTGPPCPPPASSILSCSVTWPCFNSGTSTHTRLKVCVPPPSQSVNSTGVKTCHPAPGPGSGHRSGAP